MKCSLLFLGEFGSVVSGQLNVARMDVMAGSQSVTIKMLTGTHVYNLYMYVHVLVQYYYNYIYIYLYILCIG